MVFGLYLIGIMAAVFTGLIMKKTLLPGQSIPFVMELPPYHLPSLRGVMLRTWERTRGFVMHAGMIIVPMVLDRENWPATVGIFTGIMAKEAVVGTLDALYTTLAVQDAREAGLGKAFATIPTNLRESFGA